MKEELYIFTDTGYFLIYNPENKIFYVDDHEFNAYMDIFERFMRDGMIAYIGVIWNENYNFEESEYAKANEIDDSEKCFEDILSLTIPGRNVSIGQILERMPYEINGRVLDEYNQLLGLHGIRYKQQEKQVFIPSNSSALQKQLERFSTYSDYTSTLRRHKSFVKRERLRVSGVSKRGMLLNYS